jgi:mono/diheme cytochrome c family protein
MMAIASRWILLLGSLAAPMAATAADEGDFRAHVAPILASRCVRCHGEQTPKGGLSLATARGLRAGGDGGEAVVPGRPEESLLLEMIAGRPPEMPRGGDPLSAEQVAGIRRWIEQGAPWPEGLVLRAAGAEKGPWWSLQPLVRPEVPRVKEPAWVRTPVDAFVRRRLEDAGLAPSPEADRRTLIRRLCFDLHGLPPTPGEVAAFLDDDAPDAYERLVDRLLASPRHGERWGRHWLDVVHYGDTHGYDKDKRRDNAWPYRDYVIGALNEDRPYARFIREQIAGDVLSPGDPEAAIATGFVAAGPWDFVGHTELREGTVDKAKARLNDRDDMLANTMSTFVSLTVHCARCHDHKFDPIPQADYYRLQAVFAGVERGDRPYADRRPPRRGPRWRPARGRSPRGAPPCDGAPRR